jgi:hypothetical protein
VGREIQLAEKRKNPQGKRIMANQKIQVVDDILAGVRVEVLRILDRNPHLDLAFENLQSNGEAALRSLKLATTQRYQVNPELFRPKGDGSPAAQ